MLRLQIAFYASGIVLFVVLIGIAWSISRRINRILFPEVQKSASQLPDLLTKLQVSAEVLAAAADRIRGISEATGGIGSIMGKFLGKGA